jgi:mono/diheme cytochrome c family protein
MRRWKTKHYLISALGVLLVFVGWQLFRGGEQAFANDDERFNYGSLGAELVAGIPYPIFRTLPQLFPDLLARHASPGAGTDNSGRTGYEAFGLAVEADQALPIGFSIKRLGVERVTVNCALCHTTAYRLAPDEAPRYARGGPGHTANIQGLLRFLFAAARDPRFSAAEMLPVIEQHSPLAWSQRAMYTVLWIPLTRLALRIADNQLAWMDDKPAWGPGRDDAFNLPKYVLTQAPWDDTVGNTDFPALWQLGQRRGQLLHSGGEARSVAAVIATSALGTGALPFGDFEARNRWLESFLSGLAPPPFPAAIDATLAARGGELFADHCAACHASNGERSGQAIPVDELGTDPEHLLTFQAKDAKRMNRVTATLGMDNAEMQGAAGYVARPLVGVWLLAPYLHNGSVPTLHDLLTPPEQRPAVFHRGYDVLDTEQLGFVASGEAAQVKGFRFDTRLRGNGNGGHRYGSELATADKRALIEFLKTL